MVEVLLTAAFAKAEKHTENNSDNGRAEYLSNYLEENYKCLITARSLVRFLKKKSTPKKEVLDGLSKFLGYETYEDFVQKADIDQPHLLKKAAYRKKNKRNKTKPVLLWTLMIGMTVALGWNFLKSSEKKCMVWVENHYEKTECSGVALEISYNETISNKMKQLKACDTTTFFKNKLPVVWYDKSNSALSYFSYHGIHPVNGKTLKPITETIIEAHVMDCDSLK